MPLPLIPLIASLAPSALRAAGSLFGGDAENVANKVANVVEASGGGQDAIKRLVEGMPPEARVELERLANEAKRIDNERRARELQHDETMWGETQQTARVEVASENPYVQETRPRMARQSLYAGVVYGIGMEMLNAWDRGDGADPFILGTLLTIAFTYIGARTLDKRAGTRLSVDANPIAAVRRAIAAK